MFKLGFEFGLSRDGKGRVIHWKSWGGPSLIVGPCKCRLYDLGPFYFTILSKECRDYK